MTIDPVTRSALDVVDHCQQSRVLDVRRPAAARTDHVMVVAGLAGDVGMVATGQVNALDRSQLDVMLDLAVKGCRELMTLQNRQ